MRFDPPVDGEAFMLVDALHRLGAVSIEREQDRVIAVFPAPDDPSEFISRTRSVVRANAAAVDSSLQWELSHAAPWQNQWAHDEASVRISERIRIRRVTHLDAPDRSGPELLEVRLLPSVAFGTAEHPTTRACLRFLEQRLVPGSTVADIGSGTGVIAIAAALLGAREIAAVESEIAAHDAAERNVALNGVGHRVRLWHSTLTPTGPAPLVRFDGIVANLQPDILVPLIPRLVSLGAPGGWLILSGTPAGERDSIVAEVERTGARLSAHDRREGWWTGVIQVP